jgi:hypothetical protein
MKMVVIGIKMVEVGRWMKVEGNKGNIIMAEMMVEEERDGRITITIREVAPVTVTARGGTRTQMRITQG